jgi:hypothetical protein
MLLLLYFESINRKIEKLVVSTTIKYVMLLWLKISNNLRIKLCSFTMSFSCMWKK